MEVSCVFKEVSCWLKEVSYELGGGDALKWCE